MYGMQKVILSAFLLTAAVALAQQADSVGASPGPGIRYATDAYPGFDPDQESLRPERKTPRWFSFLSRPKRATPKEQFAYCEELAYDFDWPKAAEQFDALVREWPTSEEAPEAQRRYAEILLDQADDPAEAFAELRYLVDFYSFRCDYNATVDKMYELAGRLRAEGKTIVFFRFRNTVDVRRAYEACVLRAPGAKWAPAAMLTIGELREEEGRYEEAIRVYENLRNLHFGSPEAKAAVVREAAARMRLLASHGYNRARCLDTVRYLSSARRMVEGEAIDEIERMAAEANDLIAEEAYQAARFYDSPMRTKRSAINAFERFLAEYPASPRAEAVRVRVAELKGGE